VRSVAEWRRRIPAFGTDLLPHIIANPLTGRVAKTRDGKDSFRCDASVAAFRFVTVEFDNRTREEQLAFWSSAIELLPVVALIDSGGKSIHGWIRLESVATLEQWDFTVKQEFYARRLVPLGVDRSCSNASRLSRLPGHFRADKGRWQRLLYLNS
jgi:hypothetical protein